MVDVKLPDGFRLRPESMLCFDIYATHHAVGQVYQPLLSKLGLTYPQYLVMIVLWEQDRQTVGQLGERLDLASSTLTPLIKRLESQGLVSRKRDAADERKVRVLLTPAGIALEQEASHVPGCVAEAFGLSVEQFAQMHSLLGQLRRALKAQGDSEAA
ncbi:MarR family winged helix-turn-helix transcriptional regulator [Hoeflea alexandrii]|uniref:MarR family transcriptional regulator n=1 Tax=Hoeflea alexandrii TaxID=288436 RepID=A0ABT1CUW9_9HYPH|nr:MarR family transcriptional regulator [Hoeflea alexandrii]MCO6409999.1 MarR family transcriptional regulator [Hoeflea alexandrii]MCY0152983.1 MarR family transcriptional regulator [Hoeflea alexandrii]